ncbi:MAG: DUF748 domain-containing protein [Cellvibrionaceae bacterium]|nr:DUF748 domain-containing protein [Cellvibrionaceae bacterium]
MRLLKWLIGVVIAVGVILTTVPLVAKWYLVRWLEGQGYHAEIKKLGADFIFGELSAQGVTIVSSRDEHFAVFSARADFDVWSLVSGGRLVVDRFESDSARLDLRSSPEGLRLGGFLLEPSLNRLSDRYPLEIRSARLINTDVCRATERCLRMETISVSRAKWLRAGDTWEFVHNAPLTVEKAFLRDQTHNTTLFYGAAMTVATGVYTPRSIDMNALQLSNFQFVENSLGVAGVDSPYQTQLGELKVTSLTWRAGEELLLGPVDITSLRQSLVRTADGSFMMPARFKQVFDPASLTDVHVVLEKLELRDGAVSWMDQSVTPPATQNLGALSLQLGRIDSVLPDVATPITLIGRLEREGKVRLEGEIYPYSGETKFVLDGFIQGVDLAKLAGYSQHFLNQGIDQGTVDVSFNAMAHNKQLEADTRWQLANLHIEPTRGGGSDMPLELSYDLLKDHNNSVALQMPLRGQIGSDSLQPRYIFARQMRRVMSDMAQRRVKSAGVVSPSRAVPSGKMAFQPLEYAVNGRYPAVEDGERIREMAAMLREKPHLRMVFCPVSTGGEWAEMFNDGERPTAATEILPEHKELLLELANGRGRVIRSRLIEAGAASDQIVICTPSVDMTQSGLSFISISL